MSAQTKTIISSESAIVENVALPQPEKIERRKVTDGFIYRLTYAYQAEKVNAEGLTVTYPTKKHAYVWAKSNGRKILAMATTKTGENSLFGNVVGQFDKTQIRVSAGFKPDSQA